MIINIQIVCCFKSRLRNDEKSCNLQNAYLCIKYRLYFINFGFRNDKVPESNENAVIIKPMYTKKEGKQLVSNLL